VPFFPFSMFGHKPARSRRRTSGPLREAHTARAYSAPTFKYSLTIGGDSTSASCFRRARTVRIMFVESNRLPLVVYPILILHFQRKQENHSCSVGQAVGVVFPKPNKKDPPSAMPCGNKIQNFVNVALMRCIDSNWM
jgi:hypothetical protein